MKRAMSAAFIMSEALAEVDSIDVLVAMTAPKAPSFIRGPRNGLYITVGPWLRKSVSVEMLRDGLRIVWTADMRYVRPHSKLWNEAEKDDAR